MESGENPLKNLPPSKGFDSQYSSLLSITHTLESYRCDHIHEIIIHMKTEITKKKLKYLFLYFSFKI